MVIDVIMIIFKVDNNINFSPYDKRIKTKIQ